MAFLFFYLSTFTETIIHSEIKGGDFLSGCASGLTGLVGFGVISVGSLAVWQVAAIAAAGACVAGGIDAM